MPPTPTREIVERALAGGYAVPAINIVNDLTLEAVLAAAEDARSPIIIQTSAKTVRGVGVDVLFVMWQAMAHRITVPAALHLDHCPDRALISACLAAGWQSVLFDGSALPVEENLRQCRDIVIDAHARGAAVEGEIEAIRGVEDDLGSDEPSDIVPLEMAIQFIEETGVDVFAPAIGNAHGLYAAPPVLDARRVSDLVAATGIPMALHGGTGLSQDQFSDLITRGCAKVNVSTALKLAYMGSSRELLTRDPEAADPPTLFRHQRDSVMEMVRTHIRLFGSAGRA